MRRLLVLLDGAAELAVQAWEAAVCALCKPAAAVALALLGAFRWSVAIEPSHATLAGDSLRLCERGETVQPCCAAQLGMHVLTAADHTDQVWEAAVSVCCEPVLRLWHLAPSDGQLACD